MADSGKDQIDGSVKAILVADSQTHLARTSRPFSFAVVGDLDFALPSLQTELPLGSAHSDPTTRDRSVENVGYALEPMAETLGKEDLSFILHTGDLTSGGHNPTEVREAVRFLRRIGHPVLFARGDKDSGDHFDDTLLPLISSVIGREVEQRYYVLEVADSHLIILDTSSWDPEGEQALWFQSTLERLGQVGGPVFVFGHHPVWTVAKAFCSNRAFCESAVSILAKTPVDAYFCGHTHNQSALWHRSGAYPTLQFMASPIGHPDELPTPLHSVQSLLVDPDDVIACWPGYLENTAPGWYVVRVDEGGVEVTWYHLNRGGEVEVSWQTAGSIDRFWQVTHPEDPVLISRDLTHLRRLSLRFCAWDAIRPGKRIRLNGVDVGELPPSARFEPRQIDLPAHAVGALNVVNRVEIEAPGVEASTVGNIQLEGVLPGGRIVRTRPTGQVFTWSDRWDPWKLPRLEKVMPGRPLRTLISFQ